MGLRKLFNLLNYKEKKMINNTFDLLWRDISPFAVGFDRSFDTLALLANSKQ